MHNKFVTCSVPADLADAFREILAILEWGRSKHPANDWRSYTFKDHFAALFRHLVQAGLDGRGRDAESGLLHVGHAGCRVVFILGKVFRGDVDGNLSARVPVSDQWEAVQDFECPGRYVILRERK